jgi:hypothetical protein
MRTTVTLEPDVEAKLHARMRERGLSFKAALNDALRAGLGATRSGRRRFTVEPVTMGIRADVNIEKALSLAAEMEDAEILRKLDLRK